MTKEEKTPETNTKNDHQFSDLRWRAEARLAERAAHITDRLGLEDQGQIAEELAIYHIELELQNEALRQSQQEAEAAREQYEALYELAPIGYFELNRRGRIRQVNRAGAALVGLGQTDLAGQPFTQFIEPERGQPVWQAHLNRLLKTEAGQSSELEMMRPDGSILFVRIESALRPGAGEAGPQILTTVLDITDRRQAQLALSRSEQRFRKVFEEGPLGMGIIDERYRLVQVNANFCRLLGYPEEELLGRSVLELTHSEDIEQNIALLKQLFRAESPGYQVEKRYVTKQQQVIWVKVTTSVVHTGTGEDLYALGAVEDITRQKELAAEKEQLLAELQVHSEQLRALNTRLAEVQEEERRHLARELHDRVGQTLSGLDFNLHAVKSRLEAGNPDREALLAAVDQARELVEQTSSQVRNVLADLRPPVLDDYGLVDTLHWYADRQSQLWALEITVTGQPLEPRLPGPVEIALFRIVQEALTNVAKHANASRVTISVEAQPERVRLRIVDNGRGFEAIEDKQTSWGLRIMQERAEMVGGECRIESIPGDGARVTVEVPWFKSLGQSESPLP
jgi:PAS domain S-box-containing protein